MTVGPEDTARALGSGHVDVLGSPRLIALCEEATIAALSNVLPAGTTTVGMRIQFDHLQPTAVGFEVTAEAVLEKIDGRRLKFTVSASDPADWSPPEDHPGLVDVERFMGKCCS